MGSLVYRTEASGVIRKALLPLTAARDHEQSLVKSWCAKKPASKKEAISGKLKHTTPLTLKRKHTLRASGVKSH